MVDFKLPDVGEGTIKGEIVKWHVKAGDKVKEHDILVDVETDKAVVNIPSPYSGKITKIYHKQGDSVNVGEVLLSIDAKNVKQGASVVGEISGPEQGVVTVSKNITSEASVVAALDVRRLARDLNVNLNKVTGTGVNGRITEQDVRGSVNNIVTQVVSEIKTKLKYDFYGHLNRVPLKGVRKSIADRMTTSSAIPCVTHMDEADVTELYELREIEKTNKMHLTFLPYIIRAVISALGKYPYLNASLEDEEIIVKEYYNIGIAVDTKEGLVVPVIKVAQDKDLYQLAKEIEELADKANKRKLDIVDFKGNTFTITNVGVIGGKFFTPLINPPDTGILGIGRLHDKAVVVNGKIVVRKILPLSLTFDHRVVDGAYAARFMNELISILGKPKKI